MCIHPSEYLAISLLNALLDLGCKDKRVIFEGNDISLNELHTVLLDDEYKDKKAIEIWVGYLDVEKNHIESSLLTFFYDLTLAKDLI